MFKSTLSNTHLDNHLVYKINDFLYGSPNHQYDIIVSELKNKLESRCGHYCRIIDFFDKFPKYGTREKNKLCSKCKKNYVGVHYYNLCHSCSKKNDFEYNYYHMYCYGFKPL
jgi:hypothetical protein